MNLSLYNALGEQVKVLFNEQCSGGMQSIKVSVEGLVNGVYFLKLNTETASKVELLQVNR